MLQKKNQGRQDREFSQYLPFIIFCMHKFNLINVALLDLALYIMDLFQWQKGYSPIKHICKD